MSNLLTRLKNLVSAMESDDGESPKEEIEDLINELSESQVEEEAKDEIPSLIHCSRQETAEVLDHRTQVRVLKSRLADLLLEYEKRKSALIAGMKKSEKDFFQGIQDLKEKYSVPDEGYSVSIPDTAEDNIQFEKEQ